MKDIVYFFRSCLGYFSEPYVVFVFTSKRTNAIKFYYEHVLEQPREFYNIQRPKKSQSLPGVLSVGEVYSILQQPKNIKHKVILLLIYSGGFRLSEVLNLRIEDVRSADGYLFIKGAKGKKIEERYFLFTY